MIQPRLHSPAPMHPSGSLPAARARRPARAPLPLLLPLAALTVQLTAAEFPTPTAASGYTESFLDVTLSAPVSGVVTTQRFREGDTLQAGDVILELDKHLEELEATRRQLVRDDKKKDFESTQKLFATTKGVSQEDVDKKEVEYKVAAVEHQMALENLRRRLVISPLSGIITDILLDVGEACQPYQPLVRIVDTSRCFFITFVDARAAAPLKLDQIMKLDLDTGSGPQRLEAKIVFISPVVDPGSGLLKLKLLFDNHDGKVQSGVSGRMLLE